MPAAPMMNHDLRSKRDFLKNVVRSSSTCNASRSFGDGSVDLKLPHSQDAPGIHSRDARGLYQRVLRHAELSDPTDCAGSDVPSRWRTSPLRLRDDSPRRRYNRLLQITHRGGALAAAHHGASAWGSTGRRMLRGGVGRLLTPFARLDATPFARCSRSGLFGRRGNLGPQWV